jgi:hypothetical protein
VSSGYGRISGSHFASCQARWSGIVSCSNNWQSRFLGLVLPDLFSGIVFMKVWYFLDTNIFRNLVESRDSAGMLFLRVNRRCFRLTPTTIMELVEDLLTCKAHNFLQRREALELARSVSGGAVLPAQGEFLAKHVFKTPFANPNLSPGRLPNGLTSLLDMNPRANLVPKSR